MDPSFPLVWRLRKSMAGTGVMGDLGSHVIDFARFLVGEIGSTTALTRTFIKERPLTENASRKGKVDVDDAFISIVKFKNGAIGSIEASRFCAGRKNYARVEVHGTEGSLLFDLERLNELQIYSNADKADRRGFKPILVTERVHPFYDRWWPHGHVLGWEHAMVNLVHHFFDAIANDKRVEPWGATFFDGLRVDQIMDAMCRSAKSGRWEDTL
jgi:predicted dehydrogenase